MEVNKGLTKKLQEHRPTKETHKEKDRGKDQKRGRLTARSRKIMRWVLDGHKETK